MVYLAAEEPCSVIEPRIAARRVSKALVHDTHDPDREKTSARIHKIIGNLMTVKQAVLYINTVWGKEGNAPCT